MEQARDRQANLERFVVAQADTIERALAELRGGRKRSHWMWFIFPQLRGLGRSETASFYGMGSITEAQAYLAHPLLGPRLQDCTRAVLDQPDGTSLLGLFGSPDDMKFCSSMTLFARAASAQRTLFEDALLRYCGGREDAGTVALLGVTRQS